MRTILIPKEGVPFFGDDIPDDRVGVRISRLAEPIRPISQRYEPAYDYMGPVKLAHYDYKGTIVRREGQPILAIYEQV